MGGMWQEHSEQSVQQYHSLGGQLTYMNVCVCILLRCFAFTFGVFCTLNRFSIIQCIN